MRAARHSEPEDHSLIPRIHDAEAALHRLLEQARADAEQQVREAESRAASAIASSRQELPRKLERRRREEADRRARAATPSDDGLEQLERRAEASLERAVDLIVRAVWKAP